MYLRFIVTALLFIAPTTSAVALDKRFVGQWRIATVAQAPWADASEIDPAEAKGLIGEHVVFGAKIVAAPKPLGCQRPHYNVREGDGPDMLFEGNLNGTDKAGKARNPVALAHVIGMTTPTVATLEVGCSEIAFHALAPDTLVFALDNQIYSLKRLSKK